MITDLIPAGFEIENPRLNAATDLSWTPKYPINIDYMDIRDDRLLIFTNLDRNKTREFYYLLRVVNQGTYQLPVIGAEAMYDQEFHSYNGAGVVKVWLDSNQVFTTICVIKVKKNRTQTCLPAGEADRADIL